MDSHNKQFKQKTEDTNRKQKFSDKLRYIIISVLLFFTPPYSKRKTE
jgi:hypothetical protein